MKILLLSRYDNLAASSRYRLYQYLPYLCQNGFDIKIAPLLDNKYIKNLYSGKQTLPHSIFYAYVKRILDLLHSANYNLLWIEKEAFPWIPAWLEVLFTAKIPYVVDYDDAVFHRYDQNSTKIIRKLLGNKIDQVMKKAAVVIAGNSYLAQRAINAGAKRVEILPTVIDLEKYQMATPSQNPVFTIGWIGSPATTHYLENIKPVLQEVCKDGNAKVSVMGARPLYMEGVPLEIKAWSEDTEVKFLQQLNVGIMPLTNTPWSQGKCGFKLIQYMACCLPTVGSPIGVNSKIIEHGTTGFLANSQEEWIKALTNLKNNAVLRNSLGQTGRKKVEANYCLQMTAPKLAKLLLNAKGF